MQRPVLKHKVKGGKVCGRVQVPNYMKRDEGNGFVYFVRAKGFHGILSFVRERDKIGLTNNPERRLNELNSEQAPCQIEGIRYIEVSNNAQVEAELHKKFAKNRVHGEWFDFWVWELPFVHFAYDCYVDPVAPYKLVMKLAIAATSIGLLSGLALTYWPSSRQELVKTVKPAMVKSGQTANAQKVLKKH